MGGTLEVLGRPAQTCGIVAHDPERLVAIVTKDPPDPSRAVVMIDRPPVFRVRLGRPANRTSAALDVKQISESLQRQPIFLQSATISELFPVAFSPRFAVGIPTLPFLLALVVRLSSPAVVTDRGITVIPIFATGEVGDRLDCVAPIAFSLNSCRTFPACHFEPFQLRLEGTDRQKSSASPASALCRVAQTHLTFAARRSARCSRRRSTSADIRKSGFGLIEATSVAAHTASITCQSRGA